MILDGIHDVAAGFQLRQHFFRKSAAETLFDRGQDLHSLQAVEAQFQDAGVERQAAGSLLGDAVDLFQHLFGGGPLFAEELAGAVGAGRRRWGFGRSDASAAARASESSIARFE